MIPTWPGGTFHIITLGDGVDERRTGILYLPGGPIRGGLVILPSTGHTGEKWLEPGYGFQTLANKGLALFFLTATRDPNQATPTNPRGPIQWACFPTQGQRYEREREYIHRARVRLAQHAPVVGVLGNSAGGLMTFALRVYDAEAGQGQFAFYAPGAAYFPRFMATRMLNRGVAAPTFVVHGSADATFKSGTTADGITYLGYYDAIDAVAAANNSGITLPHVDRRLYRDADGSLTLVNTGTRACLHYPILTVAESVIPTAGLRTSTGHPWHYCGTLPTSLPAAHDVLLWWAEQHKLLELYKPTA